MDGIDSLVQNEETFKEASLAVRVVCVVLFVVCCLLFVVVCCLLFVFVCLCLFVFVCLFVCVFLLLLKLNLGKLWWLEIFFVVIVVFLSPSETYDN